MSWNRNRKKGKNNSRGNRVWCKHHCGYGPKPIRNWNGKWVCSNCYKTLTKFRLIKSRPSYSERPTYTTASIPAVNSSSVPGWMWIVIAILVVAILVLMSVH